ncbi:MAG TPA: hypothetical protein VFM64_02455 [Candidatus Nitrosotenuis sp.]|nr:hypothetical protein [Candidatus Nitrosotenuis sp.]
MGQFFTDDIITLLKEGFGDSERLNRIKSDYESKKLVTIDDRKYVESLVSRYLQPSQREEKEAKIPEKRIVPPPSSPPPSVQTPSYEMKYKKTIEEKPIPKIGKRRNIRLVVVSVAVVVAAVLIVGAVAMNNEGIIDIGTSEGSKNISIDQASYARGDIISISGKASSPTSVKLVIANEANEQIWTETVSTKQDGEYSTLVIAGGDGWENSGKYTLSAVHGEDLDQVVFDYSNK